VTRGCDADIRSATERDVEAVAALHADSWRRHYRGAFSDAYLDGDVFADLRAVWSRRLSAPDPADDTVVAVDGEAIVGLAHTILDDDPEWGALLDNLHVARHVQGRGVGTRLMARSAEAVLARGEWAGLYLWVLEGNAAARAFYDARGGRLVDREVTEPPGGGATIVGLRYVWPDPSVLLVGCREGRNSSIRRGS
jgi:ribosomal protein S18 acetylase RimI-like enzyme